MIFLEKIRTKIGALLLSSELKKRNREIIAQGLKKVKTLGIIFDASEISAQNQIKEFLKSIPKKDIEYFIIGYIPNHKMKHNYISDQTWQYFTEKDFSFFMQAKNEAIISFCNHKLDLLMVLDTTYHFPIDWISSMSLARFKAGKSGFYNNSLDFMIDLQDNSINSLLKQLEHYLGSLNNG